MAWVGVFTASITNLYLNQLAFYFIISGNLDKDFFGKYFYRSQLAATEAEAGHGKFVRELELKIVKK